MAETLNLGNGNWAVKKDSLLAYNSENGNYKPLPFDFTRASSATIVNKAGLIEIVGSGEPRIDFKDNTKGALLLEGTRSNLIPYSEDFSQWNLDGGTQSVTPNYAVSPDGTQNAYRLQLDKTGVSYSRMYLDAGTIGEKTSSIWIKSNNNSTQNIGLRYDGVGVNLEITSVWKRFELTATSITVSRFQVILFDSIAGNDESCDIQIYGAQLEVGYATSYIPTSGTVVTRVADACNNGANEQVINSTEGVLYAEISTFSTSGSAGLISLSDATTSNRVTIELDGVNIKVRFIVGGSSIGIFNYAANITDISKIAAKFSENDFALWVNGTERVAINSGSIFSTNTLSELSFDRGDDGEDFYGNTKDLRVYNTALTDQELAILTTI